MTAWQLAPIRNGLSGIFLLKFIVNQERFKVESMGDEPTFDEPTFSAALAGAFVGAVACRIRFL